MNDLTHSYKPIAGTYSELMDTNGAVRPQWKPMLNQLNAYGTTNISNRWSRAQRVIAQNGVTYSAFDDPKDTRRPWELDPIPMIISPDEWDFISDGLIQRMHLLNTMLADLYGDQQLLKSGTLPSELVLANSAFHRSCCPINPVDNQYLTMLAVDLARAPNGAWRVVKDRTQTPSGAGYALENRLVVSRTFPTMFRDSNVERLAGFFAALRDRLTELSPRKNQSPRIVILTPGMQSESYFEHAYLSRYLGFPLVQGNDLTVRGNQVFLKTLGGLRQVDVILRRQNDSDCDPLELNPASILGVPGLVQAAASGEVVIANALGSGLAETPALLPFYPMLCRRLLNEEPKLFTVPTLWCGQESEMNQVLKNLDRWVIKRAFQDSHDHTLFPQRMLPEEREQLIHDIKDDPRRYIAQENTALSASPCWVDGQLVPRHSMLRAFVVATRDGWKVMPGGLARTSSKTDSTVVSMDRGGGSKDAWIPARGEVSRLSLLPKDGNEIKLSRGEDNLSSRVADNLFWLGRYVQRAELQTRMLRTILRRLTEETIPDGTPELPELLKTLSVMTNQKPVDGPILDPIQEMDRTQRYLCNVIFNHDLSSNLHHALGNAGRIGALVRDRVSMDTWRILDRLDRELHSVSPDDELTDIHDMLDDLLVPLSAFSGLGFESMTHGYGWRFMDMGFRMERAVMNALILSELLVQPQAYEAPVLDAMLEIGSSSITYRTRYQSNVAIYPLLDLLIADQSNPRSIAFQLELINEHIRELSNLPRLGQLPEQIKATELVHFVEGFDLSLVTAVNAQGRRDKLESFLNTIVERVESLSVLITERYLSHAQSTQSLTSLTGGDRHPEEFR
ncbi:circularly permuted type 2 ATP-grasp protein [Pontiellaceae bacterium B12227]|nr:circularly permuted type 2 ATP-grasp protein [Pontiellaceae bacterium B12227]